jgi:acyl dehydratase
VTIASSIDLDDAGIGVWTEPIQFEVTQDRIAAYAEATNDPIEQHLSGVVASPVFGIVPVFEALLEPMLEVVPTALFGRVVHGEQDFVFHRPIRPGDVLTSRGQVIGFEGLPNGTRVVSLLECRDAEGELVSEQYVTSFIRGFEVGRTVGRTAPGHRLDAAVREREPLARVAAHVDDDQTFRYSVASGDPVPIHLDEELARESGLPGIIAHGLCTLAMASWGVLGAVASDDVAKLRRLAVRFSKMVFPGEDLETRIWRLDAANGVTTYGFETYAGDRPVLTDGLVEILD